ncbi:MAG: hypothetical protein KDB79_11545, partial [Acidobacteria bacterium]|nr:hypothetical protein [Acidobacteriota bacterium]
YEVFSLMKPAGEASVLIEAGDQLRDLKFSSDAKMALLKAAYKASARALTTLTLERCLSTGIELNMANAAVEKFGKTFSVAQFILQTGLETVIMESICSTYK